MTLWQNINKYDMHALMNILTKIHLKKTIFSDCICYSCFFVVFFSIKNSTLFCKIGVNIPRFHLCLAEIIDLCHIGK